MKFLIILLLLSNFSFSQEPVGLGSLKLGIKKTELLNNVGLPIILINNEKGGDSNFNDGLKILSALPRNPDSLYIYQIQKFQISKMPQIFGKTSVMANSLPGIDLYYMASFRTNGFLFKNIFLVFKNEELKLIEPDMSIEMYYKLLNDFKPTFISKKNDSLNCTTSSIPPKDAIMGLSIFATWDSPDAQGKYIYKEYLDEKCKLSNIGKMQVIDNSFKEFLGKSASILKPSKNTHNQ